MPKLLIATTVPSTICGFLLPFARHFRGKGWRVDAAAHGASTAKECASEFDKVWDIEWSRNPMDYHNMLETPRYIREIVQQEEYDLVHVHTPVAAFVTRLALKDMRKSIGMKVIYTAHGFHFIQGGSRIRNAAFLTLEKTAGRWTDYLIVINREDETAANRHRIVASDRIVYMPGIGVDTNYYTPDLASPEQVSMVREELGLEPEDRLLLMPAEFNPRKRHCDALTAFANIRCSHLHLAFAGNGPLMSSMQERSAALGIADRVHFLGFRRDIHVLIKASTAVVLTSVQEGLSRSLMESLSMGVPVIGTNVRGIRDLIVDGAGYLVKPGDADDIARSMLRVYEHPEEASEKGHMGREQMAAYDTSHIVRQHELLYSRALEE